MELDGDFGVIWAWSNGTIDGVGLNDVSVFWAMDLLGQVPGKSGYVDVLCIGIVECVMHQIQIYKFVMHQIQKYVMQWN